MNDIKGIIEDCYKSDLVSDNVIKKVIEIIGQVEWQRLHDENNDICTTMGKLIITLDRIEDLEKENAELILGNKSLSAKLMNTTRKKLDLQKENAELKQKFLTVKKDDIRKAKLNECKTYEEKVEYLRQVTNYALFNDDISVMLWCFCQRGEIDTNQLTKAKKLLAKWVELFKPKGGNIPPTPIQVDTEQFLNSEVEK